MVFEDKVDEEEYKIYEVDGYKIAINKDLFKDYDYIEIKHSDNFLQQGFYASILRPEELD